MTVSNFSFLENTHADLAHAARLAEAFAAQDPQTTLCKLRLIGETLARDLAQQMAIVFDGPADFCLVVRSLRRAGVLDGSICAALDEVRRKGNRASHELADYSTHEAVGAMRALHKAAGIIGTRLGSRKPSAFVWPLAETESKKSKRTLAEREVATLMRRSIEARAADPERYEPKREALLLEAAAAERLVEEATRNEKGPAATAVQASLSEIRKQLREPEPATVSPDSACPKCGAAMEQRTARRGPTAGRAFLSCVRYPDCRGTRSLTPRPDDAPASRRPMIGWRNQLSFPGWTIEFVELGGRLRQADDTSRLSAMAQRTATEAAMLCHGAEQKPPQEMVELARLLKRLLLRGRRPAVDGVVSSAILGGSPGSTGRLEPAMPSEEALLAALTHRRPLELERRACLHGGTPLLDPAYELPFLDSMIRSIAPSAGAWCLPQAPLGPLIGSSANDRRRVDFAFSHPRLPHVVVVEIDGEQHAKAVEVDQARDADLRKAGVEVIRIRGRELEHAWPAIAKILEPLGNNPSAPSQDLLRRVWGPALAHRTAFALAEAIERGWLAGSSWSILIEEPTGIAVAYLQSALEIIDAIGRSRGNGAGPESVLVRSANGKACLLHWHAPGRYVRTAMTSNDPVPALRLVLEVDTGLLHALPDVDATPTILMRSVLLPAEPRVSLPTFDGPRYVAAPGVPDRAALLRILKACFDKEEFRPEGPHPRPQERAVRKLLAGEDVVALLPTGAGKSMIYQLAAMLVPGVTVVIDPIVALIEDQIDGLASHGIDRVLGFTAADAQEGIAQHKRRQLADGKAMFAFIAPERLQMWSFRQTLSEMSETAAVNVAVVDEAHCVSEWGHDFRTAYLDLGSVIRDVCEDASGRVPPIAALTGTASPLVLRDVLAELAIDRGHPDALLQPESFNREELTFEVVRCAPGQHLRVLADVLGTLPARLGEQEISAEQWMRPAGDESRCGIVFCRTKKDQRSGAPGVESVADHLTEWSKREVQAYHGTLHASTKRAIARDFKNNATTMLVATSAYGMGIDKPNVRWIAHVGVPGSIEAYYQEAGRAGRDRKRAHCVILASDDDRDVLDFFRKQSFAGEAADAAAILAVLKLLGPLDEGGVVHLPFVTDDKQRIEQKALLRLKMLGVLKDYLVDFGGQSFMCRKAKCTPSSLDSAYVQFVRRSQPARVAAIAAELAASQPPTLDAHVRRNVDLLLRFVYDQIVGARERATDEMLLLTSVCTTDAQIRDRILRYLKIEGVAAVLLPLLQAEQFNLMALLQVGLELQTEDAGADLLGATARYLESYPDNPGLLMLRAMSEVLLLRGEASQFVQNLQASVGAASQRYSVSDSDLGQALHALLDWVRLLRQEWAPLVYPIIDLAFPTVLPSDLKRSQRAILGGSIAVDAMELQVVVARRRRDHWRWLSRTAASVSSHPELQ